MLTLAQCIQIGAIAKYQVEIFANFAKNPLDPGKGEFTCQTRG